MKNVFPTIYRKAIDVLLQSSTSYMREQAFSYLSRAKKEILPSRFRMKSVCVYLKFDLELSIFVAKDRHWFNIREVCFASSNGSGSNIFLVHLLAYMTFCLALPHVFSSLPVKDKLVQCGTRSGALSEICA